MSEFKEEDQMATATPCFADYALQWFEANTSRMKPSYCDLLRACTERHLIPYFASSEVGMISREDVDAFRAQLDKVVVGQKVGLCAGSKNRVMLPFKLIMADAAAHYGFDSPCAAVRRFHVSRTSVDPFSLKELQVFFKKIRANYRNYYLVRFLTGMKDGEVNGLKWDNLDFDHGVIKVREILAKRKLYETKPRDVQMSKAVATALLEQREVSASKSEFVFCTSIGTPLTSANVTTKVWYPALEMMNLRKRPPYQTRHTAAVLFLAAGEKPEWVADQLGHPNVRAFIETYWKFVPKTKDPRNGSAFDRLVARRFKL